ncbi:MAG: hypothetical protein ACRC78_17820 [Planktothrix sp.]
MIREALKQVIRELIQEDQAMSRLMFTTSLCLCVFVVTFKA